MSWSSQELSNELIPVALLNFFTFLVPGPQHLYLLIKPADRWSSKEILLIKVSTVPLPQRLHFLALSISLNHHHCFTRWKLNKKSRFLNNLDFVEKSAVTGQNVTLNLIHFELLYLDLVDVVTKICFYHSFSMKIVFDLSTFVSILSCFTNQNVHYYKKVEGISYFPVKDNEHLIHSAKAREMWILILDDIACDKQNEFRIYFCICWLCISRSDLFPST